MILSLFSDHPLRSIGFALLTLTILTLWFSPRRIPWLWVLPAIFSMLAFVVEGSIRPEGLLVLTTLTTLFWWFYSLKKKTFLWGFLFIGISIFCILFGGHLLPGFQNWKILETTVSPSAVAYPFYWNLDKPWLGIFILGVGFYEQLRLFHWKVAVKKSGLYFLGISLLLFGAGALSGRIAFDPKFPQLAWFWIPTNLFFVCVAEEAFFRGFLLKELSVGLQSMKRGSTFALAITSIIFGVLHFKLGVVFSVFSGIAGLIYGLSFQRTGRIETAILVHFLVNTTHFLFWTYPFLR